MNRNRSITQRREGNRTNPSKIKPVYVMNQEGLSDLEKQAVIDGALELIRLAKVFGIDLFDFGVFRTEGYKNPDGSLKKFLSVDWYVQRGRETSRNGIQLNADAIQRALYLEPWRNPEQGGNDHYDILIVHEDIYSEGTRFVIGLAQEGIGTVISTHRFKELDDIARYECIKTEAIHELGHVFGLLPNERTQDVEYSLGKHCANTCTMRQGLNVPHDWIAITNDRLKYGALCPTCENDLKQYFRK